MDPARSASLDRLQQRLGLMRELAGSLEQAQAALLAGQLAPLEHYTAEQDELCARLRRLGEAGPGANGSLANSSSGPAGARWHGLWQELRSIERQVHQLNRVHAALLRRAQQSLSMVSRLLASCDSTYAGVIDEAAAKAGCARRS
jgi:flagellar biosynthesis/type III secretory pathway chaperone